jgi:cell division protease FtsH
VRRLIDEAYDTAKSILTEKNDEFERLAQGLIEYETLTNEEIGLIIAGKPLNRDDDDDAPSVSSGGGHSAIPKAGKPRRGDEGEADPGMEPQPN